MSPLTFLERLPLAELFVACLACGAFVLLLVVVGVRLTLRALRVPPSQTLFEGNILVTLLSVLFTMLVAFSAAGIWNDQVQARAVIQREANVAHDRPFAGASGVKPIPIEQAIKRIQYDHAQQATNGTQ